jgi:hypothetical protein
MGEGKRGKPSSELERLQIFAQLATEYFRMVELFSADDGPVPMEPAEPAEPVDSADPVESADAAAGERTHWIELFRAVLLRKFIVPDEHVSLKLVVRALRLCNYAADARITEGADQAATLFTDGMIRGRQKLMSGLAPDDQDDAHDLFEDVLYGRLLHGDADRFRRSGWAEDYARLGTVAAGRFHAEHALRKALDVVSYGLAQDLLRSPDPGGDAGGTSCADAGPGA